MSDSKMWRDLVNQAILEEQNALKVNEALNSIKNCDQHRDVPANRQRALEILRSKGVIDVILNSLLQQIATIHKPLALQYPAFNGGYFSPDCNEPIIRKGMHTDLYLFNGMHSTALFVELIRGRAFIEHLVNYDDYVKEEQGNVKSSLIVYMACGSHRFRSSDIPYTSEFDLREVFPIQLTADDVGTGSDRTTPQQLLLAKHPASKLVQIVLISQETNSSKRRLVASTTVDWRRHIYTKSHSSSESWSVLLSLELQSVDPDSKMIAGILDLRLSLIWPRDNPHPSGIERSSDLHDVIPPLLPPEVVDAHFALESARISQREQGFTLYARQWWKEFTLMREKLFSHRLIKLFALDENSKTQFVCNFVQPLSGQRILETPTIAARFVSTIPCGPCRGLGGGLREQWYSGTFVCNLYCPLAFVVRNRGDVHDHANLLCSLLLGFGLDAYVALGSRQPTGDLSSVAATPHYHAWVVTFLADSPTILFWDPVSGRRYVHQIHSGNRTHPYRTIGCLYSHEAFYANVQPTDLLEQCSFNISLLHTNPRRILETSVRARLCREILTCRGESIRLGLRVRVYSYAEEATVTWVMFACVYKPLPP
ncbi:centrosomal protein CEP76 [Paragonimus westermani]|uniref:Centrosomal protein CEP76 n=1 Tax=Paragonimus westermani TaxID=34504 RepID=A0A5J4NX66_9TREM|nr:centrosomal protein CEP76 [Paragonimus westermani]